VQEAREFVKDVAAAGAIFQDGSLPLEYHQAGFEEAKKAGKPVFTRAYGPIFGLKKRPCSAHATCLIPRVLAAW
jgi:hypothetical protein